MDFILLLLKMVSEIRVEILAYHVITVVKLVSMDSEHNVN
jgi:hypothetical protein